MKTIRTWTDGYQTIRACATKQRGWIELDSGAGWPRTTGYDVVTIVAYFDSAMRENARDGLFHRWETMLDDIAMESLANPSVTYVGNRTFWSVLEALVVSLDESAIGPPPQRLWSAVCAQLTRDRRNVGPKGDGPFGHFDDVKTYDDLYLAQYKFLRKERGEDLVKAPPGVNGFEKPIPRSTNRDVIQLAQYWTERLAHVKHVMGYEGVSSRWKATLIDVNTIAKAGKEDAVYPKNNEFWRALADLVLTVAVADEAPTTWDVVSDSVRYGLSHLPETLERAANTGADFVASAAEAAGRVANEAGRGLFKGFGTPLLVGAGLLGLFLVSKNNRREEHD